MGIIDEINRLVKMAAVASNVNDELKDLISRGDETGTRVSWKVDRSTGMPFITPRIARRNAYRDRFGKVLGPQYSESEADRIADEDYELALRNRYEELKKKYKNIPKFSKNENYTVSLPEPSVIPVGQGNYSMGSIDAKIPLQVKPFSIKQNWLGVVHPYRTTSGRGGFSSLTLFRDPMTNKYTELHEGDHTAAIPENTEYLVSYSGPGSSIGKDLSYARSPAELMVGLLSEKARKRAQGYKPSEIADAWINEMEDAIRKGWKPDEKKTTGSNWDLNVDSLKYLFYKTYMKSHTKGATDLEKEQYKRMLRLLRETFPRVKNDRGAPSWSDFANNRQIA